MNTFGSATQGKNTEKKTVAGPSSPGTVRRSSRRFPWPTRPSSTAPSSTASSIAAPCSCRPSPPASPSTASRTTWRSSRRSGCATRAACPSCFQSAPRRNLPGGSGHQRQPIIDLDWYETKSKVTGEISRYTVAHWCTTEARFRNHLKKIKPDQIEGKNSARQHAGAHHAAGCGLTATTSSPARAYIPDFGVYIQQDQDGKDSLLRAEPPTGHVLRRAPQGLAHVAIQSRNRHKEYQAQKAILAEVDAGKIPMEVFLANAREILDERIGGGVLAKA